ncbi:MAG: hypothetical protein AB7U18_16855, partial [Dehalococcoidia bacterium]
GVQSLVGAGKSLGGVFGIGLASEMEQVRAQFMAFTKDGAATEQMLAMVRQRAEQTPFGFRELATATAGLMPAARQAKVPIEDLISTAEILAASNPAQGLEGAAFALREAVSGDFTSIIERFNLPRKMINELRQQGIPDLEAVQQAMQAMGYDTDLVSNMAQTGAGRWSTLMDTFDSLKLKIATPIFEGLKTGLLGLQGTLDQNKPALDAFATSIGTGLGAAVTFGIAAIAQYGPAVISGIGSVVTFVQENWPQVQALLVQGWDTLVPIITGVFTTILPPVQQFIGFVQEHFSTIAPIVVGVVAAFTGLSVVAGIIAGVVGAIAGAVGAFSALAASVGPIGAVVAILGGPLTLAIAAVAVAIGVMVVAWTQNWGDIQGKTQAVIAVVGPILSDLGSRLQQFGQLILPELAAAWESMKARAEAVINAIAPIVEGALSAISGFLTAHRTEIETIVSAAWEYIKTTINNALTIISNAFQLPLNIIQGDWSGAWTNVKTIAETIWGQIKAVVDLGVKALPALISIGMALVKSGMQTAWDGVKTVVTNAWTDLKTAVSTGIGDVEALLRSLPGKALAAVGNLATTLFQKGVDLVAGFIRGVRSKIGELDGVIAELAGKALDAFNPFSGSPWYGTIEEGENFAKGFEIGIKNGTAGVVSAATEMAVSAAAAVPMSFAGIPSNQLTRAQRAVGPGKIADTGLPPSGFSFQGPAASQANLWALVGIYGPATPQLAAALQQGLEQIGKYYADQFIELFGTPMGGEGFRGNATTAALSAMGVNPFASGEGFVGVAPPMGGSSRAQFDQAAKIARLVARASSMGLAADAYRIQTAYLNSQISGAEAVAQLEALIASGGRLKNAASRAEAAAGALRGHTPAFGDHPVVVEPAGYTSMVNGSSGGSSQSTVGIEQRLDRLNATVMQLGEKMARMTMEVDGREIGRVTRDEQTRYNLGRGRMH